MGKSDIGKNFLFSEDCGFINGEDGDSCRYSDGSAYYHGSDGTDAYKYSDGSGYYNNADDSSQLYDAYNCDSDRDYSDESNESSFTSNLMELVIGLCSAEFAKYTEETKKEILRKEAKKSKAERIAKEKRRERQVKRRKEKK